MAAGATFYRDSGMTQALSDGVWGASELDLGTVNIPTSGDAFTSPVQCWLKNTGTTSLNGCSVSAVAGSGQADTIFDERVEFAPDSAGSPGAFAAQPYAAGDLAAGASATFWLRLKASAGDSQPVNPVNMSLRVDATSV